MMTRWSVTSWLAVPIDAGNRAWSGGPFIILCLQSRLCRARFAKLQRVWDANIDSSPVWDTFCLAELIYDLINGSFYAWSVPNLWRFNIFVRDSLARVLLKEGCDECAERFGGCEEVWREVRSVGRWVWCLFVCKGARWGKKGFGGVKKGSGGLEEVFGGCEEVELLTPEWAYISS